MQAAQHSTNAAPRQSLNLKRTKPSLRVLTATAQGMKHWSQYKKHSPLLFEVFGTCHFSYFSRAKNMMLESP